MAVFKPPAITWHDGEKIDYRTLTQYLSALSRRISDLFCQIDEDNLSAEYQAKIANIQSETEYLSAQFALIDTAHIVEAVLDDACISTAKIQDAAITNAKICDASIDNVKIQDASITGAKIAQAAIGFANISDASIGRTKIQDLAVSTAKIAFEAVGTAQIADACITSAKIQNMAVDTAKIALGAVTQALIDTGAVGTAQIADASITDAKICELTADKITAGTIQTERLIISGEGSIIYQINSACFTPEQSQNSIDGGAISEHSINADRIVSQSITSAQIASRSIIANNILSGTITGNEIKGDTIEARHIKTGEISTSKLSPQVGEELNISANTAITNKVSSEQLQEDLLNNAGSYISALNTIITQTSTQITSTVQSVKSTVNEVDGRLETLKEIIGTWQKFTADGLELGKTNSPFRSIFSNEKLSFTQDGNEIAYFANEQMYVNLVQADSIVLGADGGTQFCFESNENGLGLIMK